LITWTVLISTNHILIVMQCLHSVETYK